MPLSRRPFIVGLIVVAAVALGFVAAALTNPWRLVSLYPLAHEGVAIAVLVLAGAMLAGAGLLRLTRGAKPWQENQALLALLAALVAIPALCVGLPRLTFEQAFRRATDGEVLAVSADGEFSAVKSTVDTEGGRLTRILIRSRNGLFSRESAAPAAECPFDPFERGVPPESVRFTGDDTLAVPIADQPTTVVRFDRQTLTPQRTVMMCEAAR